VLRHTVPDDEALSDAPDVEHTLPLSLGPFFHYSLHSWIKHYRQVQPDIDSETQSLALKVCKPDSKALYCAFGGSCDKHDFDLANLMIVAYFGLDAFIEPLLLYENIKNRSSNGYTALHWAVYGSHTKAVQVLLHRGANLKARSRYLETALHFAAEAKGVELVDLLLSWGAQVDTEDEYGETPLQYAVKN
jgi:ankyrin repeat protein